MTIPTTELILETQIALFGGVTPRLRAVTVGNRTKGVSLLTYYYEGQIQDEDREFASVAATEILAHHWEDEEGFEISVECVTERLDYPELIPGKDLMVYHRYEPNFQCDQEPFPCPRLDASRPDSGIVQMVTLRALVGKVTPELRDVFVAPQPNSIDLHFYFDGPISNLAITLAQRVKDSVIQFIDEGSQSEIVKTHLIRLDYPTRPPFEGLSVYSRYEPTLPT